MPELVAIGDSLTHGFQSGAIVNTRHSYPAIIARAMGLEFQRDFLAPIYPGSGLPLNLEEALRAVEDSIGATPNLFKRLFRFPKELLKFTNDTEELYERGAGSKRQQFTGVFHNLAVFGFRVADAYQISGAYCSRVINDTGGLFSNVVTDALGVPSAPMYRAARRVLNPTHDPVVGGGQTQLSCVERLTREEGDIKRVILWLGANDCLGTVVDLKVNMMNMEDMKSLSGLEGHDTTDQPRIRRQWNLTHPDQFIQDYRRLVEGLSSSISPTTQVYVGTVPHVTIAPVSRGEGALNGKYYERYVPFYTKQGSGPSGLFGGGRSLSGKDAMMVDDIIDQYNAAIQTIVGEMGRNWHVVDTCGLLDALAVKRMGLASNAGQPLRAVITDIFANSSDHPLLQLSPIPNALSFESINGTWINGGLFSLDNIHPTTIGYGLVAELFLKSMADAGDEQAQASSIDWDQLIAIDSLIQDPPGLWDNIRDIGERYADLIDGILRLSV